MLRGMWLEQSVALAHVIRASDAGAFDKFGNVPEWLADRVPRWACTAVWSLDVSSTDIQYLAGAAEGGDLRAGLRGGSFGNG